MAAALLAVMDRLDQWAHRMAMPRSAETARAAGLSPGALSLRLSRAGCPYLAEIGCVGHQLSLYTISSAIRHDNRGLASSETLQLLRDVLRNHGGAARGSLANWCEARWNRT